jgi:hypothetical protein
VCEGCLCRKCEGPIKGRWFEKDGKRLCKTCADEEGVDTDSAGAGAGGATCTACEKPINGEFATVGDDKICRPCLDAGNLCVTCNKVLKPDEGGKCKDGKRCCETCQCANCKDPITGKFFDKGGKRWCEPCTQDPEGRKWPKEEEPPPPPEPEKEPEKKIDDHTDDKTCHGCKKPLGSSEKTCIQCDKKGLKQPFCSDCANTEKECLRILGDTDPVWKGWLNKQARGEHFYTVMKNWKTRFFSILPDGTLQYHKQFQNHEVACQEKGKLNIRTAGKVKVTKDGPVSAHHCYPCTLTLDSTVLHMAALLEAERDTFVDTVLSMRDDANK